LDLCNSNLTILQSTVLLQNFYDRVYGNVPKFPMKHTTKSAAIRNARSENK